MTKRRISAALIAALVVTAFLQVGCVGAPTRSGSSPAGPASVDATASVETTPVATDPPTENTDVGPATSGADVSGADLAAIKKQLDAMQDELDALEMPTDNDFSGAEGAVY